MSVSGQAAAPTSNASDRELMWRSAAALPSPAAAPSCTASM